MNNSEYWAERFAQIEDAQHRKAGLIAANIYDAYERAKRELDKKITLWYARFAENNDITLAEAKRWLVSKDLDEFRWDVWDYIQHGEENAIDQRWMKELENASARVHVSKYEALKIQMRQSLEELAAKYEGTMQEGMSDIYQSSFYHTAFEIQKGFEVGFDIAGIDQHLMEKVLSKPWAADGLNFSERIWKNKQLLVDTLDKELTQGLILGKDPQKVINAVSDKLDVSKSQAGRLVMTESACFGSEARKDCFKELDVDQYIIVATLDSRTSETCREMDGKVFNMSDYKVGLTAPPFHINCRTTTAPYFEDMQGIGDRAARDEVTGKTYTVPRDMKYGEWKKTFVSNKTYSKALRIKSVDDLKKYSSSAIIQTKSVSEIKDYFKNTYAIDVDGFEKKDLFEVQSVLCGYDDILREFPETKGGIKQIAYSPNLKDCGNIDLTTGISKVGPKGLGDYGTGVHETSHLLDRRRKMYAMTKGFTSYAEYAVETARKNLHLREDTKIYQDMLFKIATWDKDEPREVFAYAMESELGGNSNAMTKEIYRIVKEDTGK